MDADALPLDPPRLVRSRCVNDRDTRKRQSAGRVAVYSHVKRRRVSPPLLYSHHVAVYPNSTVGSWRYTPPPPVDEYDL